MLYAERAARASLFCARAALSLGCALLRTPTWGTKRHGPCTSKTDLLPTLDVLSACARRMTTRSIGFSVRRRRTNPSRSKLNLPA